MKIKFNFYDEVEKKICKNVAVLDKYNVYFFNALADELIRIKNKGKILQSTGLFDKNGKEAYFGDLLKLDDPKYHRCNEIEEIKFENGCFMVGNDNLGILNFVVDINGVLRGEIVGNIYENKDLL